VARRDPNALREAAHALKGAAGNLSADRLSEAAHVLELIGAESRLPDAAAAWHDLSAEASRTVAALRAYSPDTKEFRQCVS
jgi:HPt (histidine-containing phosphotransfer) domain-containing protein